jgi:hypothetical protein
MPAGRSCDASPDRCIGAVDRRKFFARRGFAEAGEFPCRQSVAARPFDFAPVEGSRVVAAFWRAITSDAGALLAGETAHAIRLTERFAASPRPFSNTGAVTGAASPCQSGATHRPLANREAWEESSKPSRTAGLRSDTRTRRRTESKAAFSNSSAAMAEERAEPPSRAQAYSGCLRPRCSVAAAARFDDRPQRSASPPIRSVACRMPCTTRRCSCTTAASPSRSRCLGPRQSCRPETDCGSDASQQSLLSFLSSVFISPSTRVSPVRSVASAPP